jgi:hypothetical protein
MYHEYRRQMQAGLKHLQESSVPLYERTSLFRIYENTVVPGLFTTAEYGAAIFRFWSDFMDLPDDVDAAVEARMDRQRVLYTGDRRFLVVIEEQVFRTRVGDADVMAGQLDRLLAVMSLPRVSMGIIPSAGERHSLTQGSFWLFDDSRVRVETVSASMTITQPRDIALYARVFERLPWCELPRARIAPGPGVLALARVAVLARGDAPRSPPLRFGPAAVRAVESRDRRA